MKSGRPIIGWWRRQPTIPFLRKISTKRNSVCLLPVARIWAITLERVAGEKMSAIGKLNSTNLFLYAKLFGSRMHADLVTLNSKQLDAFMHNFYKSNAQKMGESHTASQVERQAKAAKKTTTSPPPPKPNP